jgi:hypothetical protein
MSKTRRTNPTNRRRLRSRIIERDGWVCWLCGEAIDPPCHDTPSEPRASTTWFHARAVAAAALDALPERASDALDRLQRLCVARGVA